MGFLAAKNAKVSLGANKVVGIGTWSIGGVDTDLLESSAFGDDWKQWMMGQKDGGTVTFDGLYDPTDSTGQDALRTANQNGTSITDIRFYVNANSYWIPSTTNPLSNALITSWDVKADQSGLVRCSFTAKIAGRLNLV
jgi:hypothetical protein